MDQLSVGSINFKVPEVQPNGYKGLNSGLGWRERCGSHQHVWKYTQATGVDEVLQGDGPE